MVNSTEKQLLYLLSQTDEMKTNELIGIYEFHDYSAQYIRNILFKLKKEGFIESKDRSSYSILPRGVQLLKSINQKPSFFQREWDRRWHVVMFEFTEKDRKIRDIIRSGLLQLGFGQIYHGVYLSPWNLYSQIMNLADDHSCRGNLTYMEGTLYHEYSREQIARIWPLGEMEEQYRDKLRWFQEEFMPMVGPAAALNEEEAFYYFLKLGAVISEINMADPMLPLELLPEGWQGRVTLHLFYDFVGKLTAQISPESKYYRFVPARFRG